MKANGRIYMYRALAIAFVIHMPFACGIAALSFAMRGIYETPRGIVFAMQSGLYLTCIPGLIVYTLIIIVFFFFQGLIHSGESLTKSKQKRDE